MHVLAYAMGFDAVKAEERQQCSMVDATLRAVERTLTTQKAVRVGIREGRIRVDDLVKSALEAARPGQEEAQG